VRSKIFCTGRIEVIQRLFRGVIDLWERQELEREQSLGDFTTTYRVLPLSLLAVLIGCVATGVAWALLRLISFFTNLLYYGLLSTAIASPAGNHLGPWVVLVPVAGALVIGLMMGGALGGLEATFFQHAGITGLGAGFWPLVSLGAILGGTMRSPFTGIFSR
jgi:hypothetical protein